MKEQFKEFVKKNPILIKYVDSNEMPRKYYLLNDRIDKTLNELKKKMNNRTKKKLDLLCEDHLELILIESEEAFIQGFSLATQLLSEAFNQK